jgi:alpha-glucoside transport system substrate-binding protein
MAPAVRDAFYEAALLTIARAATKQDLEIPGLLRDVQRVQNAQPPRPAAPRTVCSTQ